MTSFYLTMDYIRKNMRKDVPSAKIKKVKYNPEYDRIEFYLKDE